MRVLDVSLQQRRRQAACGLTLTPRLTPGDARMLMTALSTVLVLLPTDLNLRQLFIKFSQLFLDICHNVRLMEGPGRKVAPRADTSRAGCAQFSGRC